MRANTRSSRSVGRWLALTAALVALAAAALLGSAATAGAVDASYRGVDFISASSGWAVGRDATIVHTVNGGRTWTQQHRAVGGPLLLDVCVLADGRHGWAVGEEGAVYRTTNGRAWSRVVSMVLDPGIAYTSVKFANVHVGWVCGGWAAPPPTELPWGEIVRSGDGGRTWDSPVVSFPGWAPVALDTANPYTATCVGVLRDASGSFNFASVAQTFDGSYWGAAPRILGSTSASSEVTDVDEASGGRIVAVGGHPDGPPAPMAFYSPDLGGSFFEVGPLSGPRSLAGVKMATPAVGYAVGLGSASVLKTSNGGRTWRVKPTTLGRKLCAVDFVSATTGYAVGLSSSGAPMVIKTTNGAASWKRVK